MKAPRVTAAEKAELLKAIEDIKFTLDANIAGLSTLVNLYDGKARNAVAEEIGQQRQRISFWDQSIAVVEREPTE